VEEEEGGIKRMCCSYFGVDSFLSYSVSVFSIPFS
jgi:hypothetical protein